MKTKYKSFDFKSCSQIIGNMVDGHYWLSDGHIAVDTTHFTVMLPTALSGLAKTKTVFIARGKDIDTDNVPDIGRLLTGGPRYILSRTSFVVNEGDGIHAALFYGHDRTVMVQAPMLDVLATYHKGLDSLNFLQNYDRATGAIHVWTTKQDIETDKPVALLMPLRIQDSALKIRRTVEALADMYTRQDSAKIESVA